MILSITSERTATVIRLCVAGDIDLSTAGQLDNAIKDALLTAPGGVLVDLAGTAFCDCAGITTLLAGRRHAIAQQVAYQVVNATGIPATILRLFGLDSVLTTPTPQIPRDH